MIYADYNATTPCLPEAAALMAKVATKEFGNPNNRGYPQGRKARGYIDSARETLATFLECREDEIFFTSGATESCNTIILSCMQRLAATKPVICYLAGEHSAVRKPIDHLVKIGQGYGIEAREIPLLENGLVNLNKARELIDERCGLVCAIYAHNENGIIQPLKEIANIAHAHGAFFMSDCTQALGKIPCHPEELGIDFAAFSAHKCYGPQGVGALYKKRGLSLDPLILGGGQESGQRSGTENTPGIAAFGHALKEAHTHFAQREKHLQECTAVFEEHLQSSTNIRIYGADSSRIPGTTLLSVPTYTGNLLTAMGAKVALSSGSACSSSTSNADNKAPSAIIKAMGFKDAHKHNTIRVSFGLPSTYAEADKIAELLLHCIAQQRA